MTDPTTTTDPADALDAPAPLRPRFAAAPDETPDAPTRGRRKRTTTSERPETTDDARQARRKRLRSTTADAPANAPTTSTIPAWALETVRDLPALVPDEELAAFLNITARCIRRWRSRGKITSIKTSPTGSGRALTPRAEVARLLVAMSGGGPGIE